jgi:hypothetical protein
VLLQQDPRDWVVYKDQRFTSYILKAGKTKVKRLHLMWAFILHHDGVEGRRPRDRQERPNLTFYSGTNPLRWSLMASPPLKGVPLHGN